MTTTADTRTPRAQRRAAQLSRVQHLVTADEHSLLEVEAYLATLPLCATGRVFIEVPDADAISTVSAPPRMTVTWFARASRWGVRARGELLARAACAWADEMLCDQADAQVTLLGGYLSTADIVEHLTSQARVDPARISVPERFGLLPLDS